MSNLITGALIVVALLTTAMMLNGTYLGAVVDTSQADVDAWEARRLAVAEGISILSTSASDSGAGTNITLTVLNSGRTSIGGYEDMDVIVWYTRPNGDGRVLRLERTTGTPADDQWSLSSISPDSFNPGIWDPEETATLQLRVSPPVKRGTYAVVAVVTPRGVADYAYFTN